MVSGALVAEIIFSYPGLGTTIFISVLGRVYPLISSSTFFFFKQKTAYEMSLRDWSSDVCSSDLPQFENAGQLVDITDKIKDWPELKTASPGHMTVATFNERLYGVPLYADVSALFYNKDLFTKAGLDPNKPPTSLAELRTYADKITALGGETKGYYLPGNCAGCNIFTVSPLMWASGATIEAGKCGDEPLVGDGVKQVLQFGRDMVKAGNVPASAQAENGETFHL